MPTYEYVCDACKKGWEIEQRMSEDPIKKCPKCGKMKAHRVISQGNFILKGGGWYADGYGSSGGSGTKSSLPPKAASTDSSSSSSTDAKPAKTPKSSE